MSARPRAQGDPPSPVHGQGFRPLVALARAVTGSLALGEVLERVARAAVELVRDASARVWVAEGEELVLRAEAGTRGPHAAGRKTILAVGEGLTGHVALTRAPLLVGDVLGDPRTVNREWMRREGIVGYFGAPLEVGDRLVGVLSVHTRDRRRFSGDDVEILLAFGSQAAIAIHNARLHEEVAAARQAEKLGALGLLCAAAAHQINNPIGIIASRAELLLREAPALGLPGALRDDLAVIQRQARRVAELVERLLWLAGALRGQPEPVALDRVARLAAGRIRDRARAAGVRVTISAAPALPPVRGEPGALHQALLHLLTNAVEASTAGDEVRLTLGPAPGRGDRLQVVVADRGSGIRPDDLPHALEPFFTTKEGQAGLGLSVAYAIVRAHDGTLDVRSEPGRGTTVVVTLPVAG